MFNDLFCYFVDFNINFIIPFSSLVFFLYVAMNGNGNYTPLRVYHNGMGRKGQFRY